MASAGVSSNTTYIESAAGVAEGGRTGFTSVVTGVLFLVAILLSPIAGIVPAQATAPALVLVGYLMFTLVKDIPVANVEDGLPALLTIDPDAADVRHHRRHRRRLHQLGASSRWCCGKFSEIHPLMWVVSIGFRRLLRQDWIDVDPAQVRSRPAQFRQRPATPAGAGRSPSRAISDRRPPRCLG